VACKAAIEAIPLSIGISIANTQFGGGGGGGDASSGERERERRRHPTVTEGGIALAGAIVFAFNVAPTEEIVLSASRMTWLHLVTLVVFSLALSYGMIFVAEFTGLERRRNTEGFLQSPVGETLLAYLIALAVAFGMIGAFHGLSPAESPYTTLAATVVLGLPATVGGAAGRLLV